MRIMSSASRPSGLSPCGCARLPDRVPHRGAVVGMAEDLVAELAGVAGARHHHRRPVVVADAADQEAEPLELLERGLGGRRPDQLLHDLAALGALDGEVVQLVGRGLDPHLQAQSLGQLAQPDAVVLVAADEAEVVVAEPEDRGVVDHAAGLVADRGVDHLPHRQLADVARARRAARASRRRGRAPPTCAAARDPSPRPSRGRPSTRRSRPRCCSSAAASSRGTRRSSSVSSLVRGWKAVSWVSTGSASGVTRWAIAFEKRFSGE